MISAKEALVRLQEGNRRFVSGEGSFSAKTNEEHRNALVDGQAPFAVILGCADSRVPVEILFDQGFGDLFVIRVAGNIATPTVLGSMEFAVAGLGTRLIVVLGHTQCGAVQATIKAIEDADPNVSPNLQAIVDAIRPSLEEVMASTPHKEGEDYLTKAIRANVKATVAHVQQETPVLEGLVQSGDLLVVGAEYALETGDVHFFIR